MPIIRFYDLAAVKDSQLKYAVIVARHAGKWVLCRHRDRSTWEIPGGKHDPGETALETGIRELVEETGAVNFDLQPVCTYSVTMGDEGARLGNVPTHTITQYGLLCFAEVSELGPLGESEIAEARLFDDLPENLTYPAIQPRLFQYVKEALL